MPEEFENPLQKKKIIIIIIIIIIIVINLSGVVWTETFDTFSERNLRFQIPPGKCGRANFSSRLPGAKVKMSRIKFPARSRPKDKTSH